YKDREDPSVTVAFRLESGELALAWTTTPWTLPSNLALAVGPDVDYAVMEVGDQRWILAAEALVRYGPELAEARRVGTKKGSELVGMRYQPLFDYFAYTEKAFRVLAAAFVTTDEGTGIVHMAPGFGEDDQQLCEANGIPVVVPVGSSGRFTEQVPDLAGLQVFEANPKIVEILRGQGALVRQEPYVHSYPHCWRSGTPLIYRAVSSWLVKVTAVKEQMLALNQQIEWVPAHVRDGSFGKWLENARDWAISRNRFWGAPIPVWKSDDPNYPRTDVYGSLDELERDFGVRPPDLHRPAIDDLTRPNPDDATGRSTMRRTEEVLDCWFESGSMPFAQVHYPFEQQDWFEGHFPADFIVEYIGQVRGWFYTMHVLATALFERPPFRVGVTHGIVLGDDGQKMSKSLRNYPDVSRVFDSYGSDAMRWFLLSSSLLRGGDLSVTEQGIRDAVREVLNPLWNSWYFLSLYANAAGYEPRTRTDSEEVLDRYVLTKLGQLVDQVTAAMDRYDLSGACSLVKGFLDALTNWYIRRSRDRFWNEDAAAFDVLRTVLERLCLLTAPLLPFVTEAVYRALTGRESVHLDDWPGSDDLPRDAELVDRMDRVREVCSTALSLRIARNLRVRLPLRSLTVVAPDAESLAPFAKLIADEVNVKEVRLSSDVASVAERVLELNLRVAAPRLGRATPKVMAAARDGQWRVRDDGSLEIAAEVLREGEYQVRLVPRASESSQVLPRQDGVVQLDLEVSPELQAEGLARDVVRLVQSARRDAGLDVSDRIALSLGLPEDAVEAVAPHRDFIAAETLAQTMSVNSASGDGSPYRLGDGRSIHITLTPAS
ncbi:MAG: class I tRNA ligase family protein, partial [Candidatus Dormibacteraeota bacterium]|nr:class I tRNA ligase family protein [Candidatus Dormibacteraeota bacterium]